MTETVARIRSMEQSFDALQRTPPDTEEFRSLLQLLTRYLESGQWLRDYELDEQGLLPEDLKRGVLSQDALFDFLERIPGHGCTFPEDMI